MEKAYLSVPHDNFLGPDPAPHVTVALDFNHAQTLAWTFEPSLFF
jgi:hypothetical protein